MIQFNLFVLTYRKEHGFHKVKPTWTNLSVEKLLFTEAWGHETISGCPLPCSSIQKRFFKCLICGATDLITKMTLVLTYTEFWSSERLRWPSRQLQYRVISAVMGEVSGAKELTGRRVNSVEEGRAASQRK